MSVCLLLINTKLSAKPRSSYLTDSPHCESLGLTFKFSANFSNFGKNSVADAVRANQSIQTARQKVCPVNTETVTI
ncbi:hypothetical protein BpHYR1_027817 [Brachionus plicatilis]|uniref:Uncharacterized protein n=1 Tax=Brachionus plicatilis TaxID=10195 RepID=A0A3M7S4S3_BRAPC|nr:hypothetical protein BpHYR1_027817 [Brachionus plicatilis]